MNPIRIPIFSETRNPRPEQRHIDRNSIDKYGIVSIEQKYEILCCSGTLLNAFQHPFQSHFVGETNVYDEKSV